MSGDEYFLDDFDESSWLEPTSVAVRHSKYSRKHLLIKLGRASRAYFPLARLHQL